MRLANLHLDLDPTHWVRETLSVLGKALGRLWGRDVMLYTGGVSFFVLLAVFPGLAILIGLYSLLFDPAQAASQADLLSHIMPIGARSLFAGELDRLGNAPRGAISTQSGVALVIGVYAAHRGFKALLAGLSFIHEEDRQRGFVGFNLMALVVLVAAFLMFGVATAVFLGLRVMSEFLNLRPLAGISWIYSEWTWASIGAVLGMTLIYRYAMSRDPVIWRASLAGGAAASLLSLGASWLSAIYVEQIAALGATYGSVAAVIIFLIWLSWTVNCIFFGGALATETELALQAYAVRVAEQDAVEAMAAKPGS